MGSERAPPSEVKSTTPKELRRGKKDGVPLNRKEGRVGMGLGVRPEELAHLSLFFKKAGEADKRSLPFRDSGIDSGYISISEERSNNSQPQGKWWYHVYGTGRQNRHFHGQGTGWSSSEKHAPLARLLVTVPTVLPLAPQAS